MLFFYTNADIGSRIHVRFAIANYLIGSNMNEPSKKTDGPSNQYLLEKLWDVYISITDRRRKSLKHLIIVLLILIVVSMVPTKDLKFTLFGITSDIAFNKSLVLSLAPLLIIIFTTRFWYLFAHSVINYVNYLECYQKFYAEYLMVWGYGFRELYDFFKMRDITESMNIFLFPKKMVKKDEPSKKTEDISAVLSNWAHNCFAILLVIIPMSAYWMTTVWIFNNEIILFAIYAVLGILKLVFIVGLIIETWERRAYYMNNYYMVNP